MFLLRHGRGHLTLSAVHHFIILSIQGPYQPTTIQILRRDVQQPHTESAPAQGEREHEPAQLWARRQCVIERGEEKQLTTEL